MYQSETQQNKLNDLVKTKSKYDMAFCYHHQQNEYCVMNESEIHNQFKQFKKLHKSNLLTINLKNNRTKRINGRLVYILVIQSTDKDGTLNGNPHIDPLGLGFDDGCYLVSGMIYAFLKESNRDSMFKWTMGINKL